MSQQTINRDEILERVDKLLTMDLRFEARHQLWKLVRELPWDQHARSRLASLATEQPFKRGNGSNFQQAFQDTYRSDAKATLQTAMSGWVYASSIDAAFQANDEALISPQSSAACAAASTSNIPHQATPSQLLNLLTETQDLRHRWALANEFTNSTAAAFIQDDFIDVPDSQLWQQATAIFTEKTLNIVVVGAGPAGLAMANAIKYGFGEHAQVLLVDNRIEQPHIKKTYNRHWLLNVGTQYLIGSLDPQLVRVLDEFGVPGYIGASIAVLETLLLLSCRKLGVQCLFHEDPLLDSLQGDAIDLVFDASGNRLTQANLELPAVAAPAHFQLPVLARYGQSFAPFGITDTKDTSPHPTSLLPQSVLHRPHINGSPLVNACFKITHIPTSLKQHLLSYVVSNNQDSRFYIWEGKQIPEINELLALVNLLPDENTALASELNGKTSLATLMVEHAGLMTHLDPRLQTLFKMLHEADNSAHSSTIHIEPPHRYSPYIRILNGSLPRVGGTPLVPIGDSLFNGHPKVGNGLANHLRAIGQTQATLLRYFGT